MLELWLYLPAEIAAKLPVSFPGFSGIDTSGILREKVSIDFHCLFRITQVAFVDLPLQEIGIISKYIFSVLIKNFL